MSDKTHDVIVVGLGGVGSAAVYHLAKRGVDVLGIDQFVPPHRHGSSHGQTRVIRQAYFEHPNYVPLLQQSYRLWEQLEAESGQTLFHRTGLLEIGPPDGIVIPGVRRSAEQFDLDVECMTMREAAATFPGLGGDDAWSVVFEKDAGYLMVDQCVQTHLDRSQALGAKLAFDQPVVHWQARSSDVVVQTRRDTFRGKRLILATGPWAANALGELDVPLQVTRKHVYWYEAPQDRYGQASGFPCYFYETPGGYFYGMPIRDSLGLKVARHSGGERIDSVTVDSHRPDEHDRSFVETFLKRYMPEVTSNLQHWSGCYYTVTPDEHFIVDRIPRYPNVTLIAGLSGHGFKFTSVLGQLAAGLAIDEQTCEDKLPNEGLDFLGLDRFHDDDPS